MASIFISYSHQDEAWKDRVHRQLKVLETAGIDLVTLDGQGLMEVAAVLEALDFEHSLV